MGGDIYDVLVDESYFDGSREYRVTGFDQQLLREPLTMLPVQRPLTLAPDASVSEAMRAMQRKHTGCVIITGDGSTRTQLEGIFTERDAVTLMADDADLDAPIEQVMTENPVALSAHDTVATAIAAMSTGGYRRLPIVDTSGRPTGFLQANSILHFLVDHFPATVYNLPPTPHHTTKSREGA